MAKYMRLIKMIEAKLNDGKMNTVQIKEYVNLNYRNGIQSHALNNILSKNPQFVKVGEERTKSILGGSYTVSIWGLSEC